MNAIIYPLRRLTVFLLLTCFAFALSAQVQTVRTGSFIINMGVVPQTVNNGLKPYGMLYDLMANYNIPVKWVIAQGKTKDGVDFIHNGIAYRGGTFIIPAQYRTTAVNNRIAYWQSQGVVGANATSNFTVDVTHILQSVPRFAMDAANGSITISYLNLAGLPATSYYYKTPAQLNNWVLCH